MSLYIVVHNWKKEDVKTVTKKVIEALAQTPEGMNLCSVYSKADLTGAWCVWQAKSDTQIIEFLKKMIPEMENIAYPVMQFYPPGSDIYSIMHVLLS